MPQQELVEKLPTEVFCGKMLIQQNQKSLWECAYSIKTFSESKVMRHSTYPVSQPKSTRHSTQWELQAVCIKFELSPSLLSSSCPDRKLRGLLGKPAACLVYLQNYQSCIVHT